MSKLIKPPSNFTTIPNHIINDKRLSFKSKGLFMYLISKPDGWSFSHDRIMLDTNDGERSILSGLKELEELGLLTRSRVRVGGVYKGVDYILSFDFLPNRQNVDLVSPNRQNVDLQNVDLQNVDLQNVDNNKDSLKKKDKEEEREIINVDLVLSSELPDHVDSFLDELCKSKGIKNPLSYRSKILNSLSDSSDKNHKRTILAYEDFIIRYRPAFVLPAGVSIFDLIGRA